MMKNKFEIQNENSIIRALFKTPVNPNIMDSWFYDFIKTVNKTELESHLLLDLRNIPTLCPTSFKIFKRANKFFHKTPKRRSIILHNSELQKLLFETEAKTAGHHKNQRYINSCKTKNWREAADAWLKFGTEPN